MLNYEEIKDLIHLLVQTPYKSVSFKYGSLELNLDRDDLNNEGSINQVVPNNSINEIQKHIAETVIKKPIEINEQKTITEKESTKYKEIVAPMVGTFYSKPSPESEPFVKVGDVVSKGYTVCILEAMKLYNEIESEIDGEIAEVLIKDGELVEYGQPLFLIK